MGIQRRINIPGTVTTAADVLRFIANSYDVELLRRIQEMAYRRLKGELTDIRRNHFQLGDEVSFYSKKRGHIYGVITEIMRANARVQASDGMKWRVSINLLNRKNP